MGLLLAATETSSYDTELIDAVQSGNITLVQKLLEKGVSPDVKDETERTPLMWASWKGFKHIASLLIKHGADVNAKDKKGWTPLMIAAYAGDTEIVKLLLQHGARVNDKDNDGMTPLIKAARKGFVQTADLLIKSGANIDERDKNGGTPLMWASWEGQLDMVKFLIEKGSNVNARSIEGETPLMLAALLGHCEILKLLLKNGAMVKLQDKKGETALKKAVYEERYCAVKILLEFGANPNIPDNKGETPLELVQKRGYKVLVDLMSKSINKGGGRSMKDEEKDGIKKPDYPVQKVEGPEDATSFYLRETRKEFENCMIEVSSLIKEKVFHGEENFENEIEDAALRCHEKYFRSMKGGINITGEDTKEFVRKEISRQKVLYRDLLDWVELFSKKGINAELTGEDCRDISLWNTGFTSQWLLKIDTAEFCAFPPVNASADYFSKDAQKRAMDVIYMDENCVLLFPEEEKSKNILHRIFGNILSSEDITKNFPGSGAAMLKNKFLYLVVSEDFTTRELESMKSKYGVFGVVLVNPMRSKAIIYTGIENGVKK